MPEDKTAHTDNRPSAPDSIRDLPDMLMNAPIGCYTTSPAGRFLSVNPALTRMLGYETPENLMDSITDIGLQVYVHPEEREQVKRLLASTGEVLDYECRWYRRGGEMIWVSINARAIPDDNEKPHLYQGFATDITPRKQAERLLQEREAFTRTILDNLPIGLSVNTVNEQVEFTYMNDNFLKIYRTTKEALEGPESFWNVVYEDPVSREEIKQRVLTACAGGDPDRMQWDDVPFTRNGETFFICARNIPLPDRNMMISTVWDVTARKRAEEEREKLQQQLNQAHKMESIGRLAGGVAHDFNNMLSIINGYAEIITEMLSPTDPVYDKAQKIRTAGTRSADIVRQLLAFARKQTILPVVMNLNENVPAMLQMLRSLIGENIDLVWKPGSNLWLINIDPAQIGQILANLAANARDAIADIGRLTIETQNAELDETYCADHAGFVPGQFVLLAVSDNGCGMDKDVLENLFEPFFTTKAIGRGTGLVLPTVYGIVKQNNGFINVYSEPGQGTTFRIYLPRHTTDARVPDKEEKQATSTAGYGETVLVLEDEANVLRVTRDMLESLGYSVLTANRADEAMALAEAQDGKIDLLITDIVMPDMNGREFSARLHAVYPEVKTLFMSGYTANVIAHHNVLDEGMPFIEKPFSLKALAARVKELLSEP